MATQEDKDHRGGASGGDPGRRASTLDPDEIAAFSALADGWWDRDGPMKALHRLNPARLAWLRQQLVGHFGRDRDHPRPLAGLTVADIGCGGGLASEPLARLGARVTGIDGSPRAIAAARAHAGAAGLEIDYRIGAAEELAGERFDAVIALEVVEHVAERAAFVAACCACLRPGGPVVLATLNRTLRSFLLAIVAAERVLRWLPAGSHDWRRFVKPSELARDLRRAGASTTAIAGLVFDPLTGRWRLGRDVAVNYMLSAVKAEEPGDRDLPAEPGAGCAAADA